MVPSKERALDATKTLLSLSETGHEKLVALLGPDTAQSIEEVSTDIMPMLTRQYEARGMETKIVKSAAEVTVMVAAAASLSVLANHME